MISDTADGFRYVATSLLAGGKRIYYSSVVLLKLCGIVLYGFFGVLLAVAYFIGVSSFGWNFYEPSRMDNNDGC